MAGSLFERLTLGAAGVAMDEDSSIRQNIARILSTHQGAVQSLPEYGLPDLNDATLSKSALQMRLCAAIEENIRRFEPRLCDPYVVSLPPSPDNPLALFFAIKGNKVDAEGRRVPWRWDVSIEHLRFGA